jgi:hypothetical protein
MLDKVFGWLGFVRASQVLTEKDVDKILVDYLINESPFAKSTGRFSEDSMREVSDLFKKNTVLKEFLDWTILQDVTRFYSASEAEHQLIRGAISRTRYFRTLCVTPEKSESKSQKLNLKRYITNI